MTKFTINRDALKTTLIKAESLAKRSQTLAITECVHLYCDGDTVWIETTDLETGYIAELPAEVESQGKIAVNAKKLLEIIRVFPSADVLLNEVETRWLEISCENLNYHLVCADPDDFPTLPEMKDDTKFEINSDHFSTMIKRSCVIKGASDDQRAHINGVLFEVSDSELRMVATDGSRLNLCKYPVDAPHEITGTIIPKRSLESISKISEGSITLSTDGRHFQMTADKETVITRLLEGDFPKFQDIIGPQANNIKFEKSALQAALRRQSILLNEEYKGLLLTFSPNSLVMTVVNPNLGESKEEISVHYEGEPFEAAFNPRYFIDTLANLHGDNVNISITDNKRPCVVTDPDSDDFISVVMPMRT